MFAGTADKLIYCQILYIYNIAISYVSLIAHMLPIKLILSFTGYKPEQSHCSCGSIIFHQRSLCQVVTRVAPPGDHCCLAAASLGKFMIILRVSGQDEGHVRWHKGPHTIVSPLKRD